MYKTSYTFILIFKHLFFTVYTRKKNIDCYRFLINIVIWALCHRDSLTLYRCKGSQNIKCGCVPGTTNSGMKSGKNCRTHEIADTRAQSRRRDYICGWKFCLKRLFDERYTRRTHREKKLKIKGIKQFWLTWIRASWALLECRLKKPV